MSTALRRTGTSLVLMVVGAVVAVAALVGLPAVAHADTAPPAGTPETVSADALPTVQVNGVVWSQAVVGNTVYVGGAFTSARPAGSPAGTNETPRGNLLAYNLQTGALITSFAPTLNKQVLAVAASPDGSRIYVGGDFTQANGVNRYRIAAFSTATGQLITAFNAGTDYKIRTIVATNSTVYVGGGFSTAGSASRLRLAAFNASNGATTPWAPSADNNVMSMVLAPDGSGMVLAGNFSTMDGVQARGTAKVDLATGALLPWSMNQKVQNWGTDAAILSLSTDGTQVFGSGYVYGANGNLEGAFAANPATGDLNWVEDCHGDTYWTYPSSDALYVVSHEHYCGNIGQFPQTNPWSFQRASAFTKDPRTTITHDPYGYYDWAGTPAPDMLRWWPTLDVGTYTGQSQAAWTVTGTSDYLLLGGEFPKVNGTAQQGLVRFAKKTIAPNLSGPVVKGGALNPTAVSLAAGSVRITWPADWDRDNESLNYQLVRDNDTAHPVWTGAQKSTFWSRPAMGFIDRGLVAGSSHRYKLLVSDAFGNTATSENVSVQVSNAATSNYADGVLADGASHYWRLDESSPTASYDWAGFDDLALGTGVARGASGGTADGDQASTFDGTDNGSAANGQAVTSPNTFTAEAWIKTTSTSGGKILGFGGNATGMSGSYDRHVYMTNDGKLVFGTWLGFAAVVQSPQSYNDGQWHHVVATLGGTGEYLYVDGRRVGADAGVTSGQDYTGYWRVGSDNLGGWPNQPSSNDFQGTIDDVAVYPTQLSFDQVRAHYALTGRSLPGSRPADAYGQAVYDLHPDLYWRLGETSGAVAGDASVNGDDGGYTGGYTQGGSSAVSGGPDGSASFDGASGGVYSSRAVNNPQTFSEELWFKTTTTNGGKLIGFGNQQTGGSSGYDRHVYINPDGRLTFGTWLGFTNTVDSPQAYNDGSWHHLVAEDSGAGLRLYVDGGLVASNSTGGAQDYTGYWRIGGDSSWGCCSSYFNGSLDEVAVYPTLLTDAQVAQHHQLGTGTVANQPPTAAFTSTSADLTVSFDGSSSHDPDGSVAGYAWDFGDGGHATGASPSHTYTDPGTHAVTLTVTDDKGATAQVTQSVTTTAPNQAPTAAFTATPTNLSVSVDGSSSGDADGTVTGYAWQFGDGATATGATATHAYATPGVYTVTLTVTDDDGATGTVHHDVTVTAPPNVPPTASFTAATTDLKVSVDASASGDSDGTVAGYAWTYGDGATGSGRTDSHTYAAAGTYTVGLVVTDDKGATATTTRSVTVTAPPANVPPTASFTAATANLKVSVDASASSDSDGTVAGYAWTYGDGGTGTGRTDSHTYTAAGTYTVKLTVTDDKGASASTTRSVTVTAPPANVPPTASFTAATTDLKVSVDASASSDSDGTVAGYAWTYGDGATGSGRTDSHTYTAAGTYTVKLTVTDDGGASTSTTKSVTVTAPAGSLYAKDTFTRTVTGGLGTADQGGSWTLSGGSTNFSVASGAGRFKMPKAGSTVTANLDGVSSTSTEVQVDAVADAAQTGSGTYIGVVGRKVGADTEGAKVRLLADGRVTLTLVSVVGGTETSLRAVTVTGLTNSPATTLRVRLQVFGTSPATVRAKVWAAGSTEPTAWTASATDSAASLQAAGSVGLSSYLSGTSTNAPETMIFDNFAAGPLNP